MKKKGAALGIPEVKKHMEETQFGVELLSKVIPSSENDIMMISNVYNVQVRDRSVGCRNLIFQPPEIVCVRISVSV